MCRYRDNSNNDEYYYHHHYDYDHDDDDYYYCAYNYNATSPMYVRTVAVTLVIVAYALIFSESSGIWVSCTHLGLVVSRAQLHISRTILK